MAQITINVDLTGDGFDEDEDGNYVPSTSIRDQVVREVATQLIHEEKWRDEIQAAVKSEVFDRVSGIVQALIEEPIQEVDWAGNPKGEPRTVRQMLTDVVRDWAFQAPVKNAGSYSEKISGLGAFMQKWVRDEVTKSLKPYLARAEGAIAEEVRKAALEATADLFAEAVKR